MEEQQPKYPPKGKASDVFDREAHGYFTSPMKDLKLDSEVAKIRNLIYLVLIIICVLSVVYVSTTASYKTYVVRVDNATGQVEAGGELKASNYSPRDAEIKHFLSQFVTEIRSVPLDPILYKSNWTTAQHFLTKEAQAKLNAMIAKENPTAKLGHVTVQPILKSIQLQPGSNRTYQVRWAEEEYAVGGGLTGKKDNYVALFTIVVQPQSKEEELLINPLGIKIADLSYAKESETRE